jgi:hypothetical protein
MVIDSTVGYGACPDLGFLKSAVPWEFPEAKSARLPTEEEFYLHRCTTFTNVNNRGGEILERRDGGRIIKFRPCGWAESFWMIAPTTGAIRQLPGDRCAP